MPFFGSSGTGFFMLGGGGSTPPPLPAMPPVINSAPSASGVIGAVFTPYTISATNSPTSFGANVPPPAGLVFTPPNQITGTPTGPAGTTNVTLSATNADGTGTRNLPITITTAPQAPVITAGQSISGTAGTAITPYTVTQSTTGTPPVTWSATGLPANLTIAAATGVISGTPTTNTGSPFTSQITATNTTGSDTKPLTITVAAGTTPGAWEVTYSFPGTIAVITSVAGTIPLANWTGWNPSYAAGITDNILYNDPSITTQDQMPVKLYATFGGQPEVRVDFDNWGGTTSGSNRITEWGYNSANQSIVINGSNSTGNPIALRLVRE